MKALTIHAYKYDELSDDAKEKARKWLTDDPYHIEPSLLTEDFEQSLSAAGIHEAKVWWSLSCCQGDGVAFVATLNVRAFIEAQVELLEWVDKSVSDEGRAYYRALMIDEDTLALLRHLQDLEVELDIKIDQTGRHTHWNSMQVYAEVTSYGLPYDWEPDEEWEADPEHWGCRWQNEVEEHAEEIREGFAEYVKQVSKRLERDGYAEIAYQYSQEAVEESMHANEYLFTEDGSRRTTLDESLAVPVHERFTMA